jgi:hypothetical protein
METDIFKILIIKFLNKNFPISKIKKKGDKRFRRGIYIPTGYTGKDDKQYYINDIQDLHLIQLVESFYQKRLLHFLFNQMSKS